MSSLFLGEVVEQKKKVEIHAFTKDLPFREFKIDEIADKELYNKMLNGRFRLLSSGKPFFCTAINPKISEEIEENPHDSREDTVHFVAIDENNEILSSLSVAIDTGLTDNNSLIGLPLENRWKQNGFSEGNNLDQLRESYLKNNFDKNKNIEPYEMCELYRHYKLSGVKDTVSRLAVYTGAYHLLVREARNKGLTQTHIWVYDAVIKYFNLYRFIGAGVLRDKLLNKKPEWLSPNKRNMKLKNDSIFYKDEIISRNIAIPYPQKANNQIFFENKSVSFLDGLIDIHNLEKMIQDDPISLSKSRIKGLNLKDRQKLRFGLGVVGRRCFEEQNQKTFNENDIIDVDYSYNGIGK